VREVWEESGLRIDAAGLRPVGYERVTVDGDATAHRWPHRRNYVACFAYSLQDVAPAVAPRLDDVDAAEWAQFAVVRERCSREFWWPLLECRDLWS